jgi:hypothetical protein
MSAFPPDWQVYEDQEFFSFGTTGLEGDLGLHVLLQVHDNGRSTGLFRTVITGQSLSLNIPTSELFTTVPEEYRRAKLSLVCRVADATPPANTLVSAWQDIEELIR